MTAVYWTQQLANGLMLACLYATLAAAYALLQGITNRIILSFGDFASFGAFAAVNAAYWSLLNGQDGAVVMVIGLGVALVAAAALGRAAHALVFRPIISTPNQAVMIASIGLSIALQETMRFSADGRDLWLPPLSDLRLTIMRGRYDVSLSLAQILVIAACVLLLVLLLGAMRHTRAGRLWRAVAQNPRLAQLSGVDTAMVFQWSFVCAALLAAAAGWIVAVSYGGVSFVMGLSLGFKAMFAAIIGGFGRLGGAIAGGIFLALVETAWTAALPMNYRDVAVFAIIVGFLVLKPEGLLGEARRSDSEAPT
jgi:branched-chain amino acid transport system permease protein